MASPSVSVLIPVYNGERTIAGCIDSVLAQDWPGLDVVVVNDCSTDGTAAVLERYRDRVRLFRNERNSGIAKTYNRAIREARGDVVLTLASDCRLRGSDYIRRMALHFEDPTVGAVVGKSMMSDWKTAPWLERVFTRLNILDTNSDDTGYHEVNFVELRCDGYRRELLLAVGGLNEDLFRSNEDQDLSIRIARRGGRLFQDSSLEFELGFGGTEDTLGKLLSKQGQYARGQAYIAVNYGIGSRQGLWTNPNRRLRAVHRMSQVAMLPALVACIALAALSAPLAELAVLLLLAARLWWYSRLAADLAPAERAAATLLGPACDLIYSSSFLYSAAMWICTGKSLLSRRGGSHLETAPRA